MTSSAHAYTGQGARIEVCNALIRMRETRLHKRNRSPKSNARVDDTSRNSKVKEKCDKEHGKGSRSLVGGVVNLATSKSSARIRRTRRKVNVTLLFDRAISRAIRKLNKEGRHDFYEVTFIPPWTLKGLHMELWLERIPELQVIRLW